MGCRALAPMGRRPAITCPHAATEYGPRKNKLKHRLTYVIPIYILPLALAWVVGQDKTQETQSNPAERSSSAARTLY